MQFASLRVLLLPFILTCLVITFTIHDRSFIHSCISMHLVISQKNRRSLLPGSQLFTAYLWFTLLACFSHCRLPDSTHVPETPHRWLLIATERHVRVKAREQENKKIIISSKQRILLRCTCTRVLMSPQLCSMSLGVCLKVSVCATLSYTGERTLHLYSVKQLTEKVDRVNLFFHTFFCTHNTTQLVMFEFKGTQDEIT